MAVLGTGGVLDISRAIPEPIALSSARINTGTATTTISLTSPGYWAGDRIIVASSLGVPFDVNGDGYADCPDGHGIYRGGTWDTGVSRSFYTGSDTDASPFYHQYEIISEPLALTSSLIQENAGVVALTVENADYLAGDQIIIASLNGVPFDVDGDGYADCPDGHGIYRGGIWDTGISRSFYTGISTDESPFYRQYQATAALVTQSGDVLITQSSDALVTPTGEEDDEAFYNNTGKTTYIDGFMSREGSNEIRLWLTESAAEVASGEEKVMHKVDCGNFVFTYYETLPLYVPAVSAAAAAISSTVLPQDEQLLASIMYLPAGFQKREDYDDFYNNAANTGLATQADGYMSRDELDRIRLWTTEAAAHSASGTEKAISKVKCGNFVVTYYDDAAAYTTAINTAATSLNALSLLQSEQPLTSVITLPAGFDALCAEANRNWKMQCDLQEWVMSIDATNLDTTAIGETFGEHVKSLVRGAGSLQFFADHRSITGEEDSLALLRLVLLTQNQCNTRARFYLYKGRNESGATIDGSVYYECDILLTNSRLNTRATEAIAGTADFVATSEIKIKVLTG